MPIKKRPLTTTQRLAREKAIIKDLRAGKLSYRKIAVKHKVSLPTVNSKARKAGISRSRSGPAGLRKAAARTSRTKMTTSRTKMAVRRPTTAARKKVASKPVARKAARRPTISGARAEKFQAQLQDLVLAHYPKISLKEFSRLSKRIVNTLK